MHDNNRTPKKTAAYHAFVRDKIRLAGIDGIEVSAGEINPLLEPHQNDSVRWALRGACRALFLKYGLGKTIIQIEIMRILYRRFGGRKLFVVPLGARQEFQQDAELLRTGNVDRVTNNQRAELQAWLETGGGSVPPDIRFIRTTAEAADEGLYITNYESVREGKIDVSKFDAVSLDEADILRGFGGTKTFREFMALFAGDRKTINGSTLTDAIKWRFVATATPSPNEYIELLAYSAFLGVLDVSQAKTRFFKRDATKADSLTLHPHKSGEFWLWVSSWALFLQSPADLGYDDSRYVLPELEVRYHEVAAGASDITYDRQGRGSMGMGGVKGVPATSREKRRTLDLRIARAKEIVEGSDDHFLLWHDLEDERRAIERAIPDVVSVYGTQDLEKRELSVLAFRRGEIKYLAGKPSMLGAGVNLQYFCHRAIFCGIGYKFRDFVQAIHRLHRFLQKDRVIIDIIYAESERLVLESLKEKWVRDTEQRRVMSEIVRTYGLTSEAMSQELKRGFSVARHETRGERFTAVNNDCVEEFLTHGPGTDSAGLILTSIPFSTQYEYSPNLCDFGHSDNNEHFFEQMEFLIPQLYRVLKPGRVAAIHVKDRIVPGGLNGLGFQTVYPFHRDVIDAFSQCPECRAVNASRRREIAGIYARGLKAAERRKLLKAVPTSVTCSHRFGYMGMKTIVTDVVRENNQTYRLGWSEQCKDGSKMGVGMPEYLLIFRKPPTDTGNAYADEPVLKSKGRYSRSRWQTDAHAFTRSSGERLLSAEELRHLKHDQIFRLFKKHNLENIYSFEEHVQMAETLETCTDCSHIHTAANGKCECDCTGNGRLPTTFMLLQPQSWSDEVWSDVTRMLTLNSSQSQQGKQTHLCPLQLDICDRAITQWTNEDDLVLDPFGGVGTVAYRAVTLGRRGYSIELNSMYYTDSIVYCETAEKRMTVPTMFDTLDEEKELAVGV
jgi:SAM-dependent methyltransferase